MNLAQFTFNAFAENTYLLFDNLGECWIIDPGMSSPEEDEVLFDFIAEKGLKPSKVINTHCHIDHILGNASCVEKFGIELWAHPLEKVNLERAPAASMMWDIPYRLSPDPHHALQEGDVLVLGEHRWEVVFVPGHAPGHVALIEHSEGMVMAGDVLFRQSVGRVDLPGCNAADLVKSIQKKLYTLPDHFVVYPGHGPETTIGFEKENNTFVRHDASHL
jgi:glyoxylase-like metal-dependent hydrolase (beta-lactamase superfamily II)